MHAELESGSFPTDVKCQGFVLEEYIPGVEVDVDGWASNGKVQFMLVSDNRAAVEPNFLEIGGIYPSQLPSECLAGIEQMTTAVFGAFPGVTGCFHLEAKLQVDKPFEVFPIELNMRTGGAECPSSVAAVSGYYLPVVAAQL